ncbi:MAG: hypothetical protein IPK16_04950 [Anaerolineales bacterium]|nr:hypothetical protein [Anaerolineales bacterium]
MTLTGFLNALNVLASAVLAILSFSLLAYTLTYNFRNSVARRFVLVLLSAVIVFTGDVALDGVTSAASAERWLRFQWLGIAWTPAALYIFALAVLATTNFRIRRRNWIGIGFAILSTYFALDAIFGHQIVGDVHFAPPLNYLQAGPYFWVFAIYFAVAVLLALSNIWLARRRCLAHSNRQRMTYLLLAFAAPAIGVFPYLVAASQFREPPQAIDLVLTLSLLGNLAVGFMLLVMSYSVAYFGVLTPDRVVRYRLLRFFMRGPVVAILIIAAILVVPKVERILGLPRDVVLFGVITFVIVFSQLFLSVTKTLVDRLIYREDREEVAWLRELDRRMLATSDLRQLLENNLTAMCELLRVPAGFVAAVVGPDLMLEAVVGSDQTRTRVLEVQDWAEGIQQAQRENRRAIPYSHQGFWIWPLVDVGFDDEPRVYGVLGVLARTQTPILGQDELNLIDTMLERFTHALADRRLNSNREPSAVLLDPSQIHSPEFEAWVKEALSHYWGGPKLTRSPLIRLRVVSDAISRADDDPTKALRLVLGAAIERLRPEGKQNFTAPEWLLYNILEMRFVQGRKVREIADRLAMSESDLYRKQRVAIGQLARVLTEMEQENTGQKT